MALTRKTLLKRTPFKRKPPKEKAKAEGAPKRKKKPEKRKLVEKLDAIFSKYIRLRDAQPHTGWVRCISCGSVHHWTKIQNGHYCSRRHLNLRWSEINCNVQCCSCNIMQHGNILAYRRALIKKYGEKEVDKLEALAQIPKHWSEFELDQMIKYYTALVEKIREEKGL